MKEQADNGNCKTITESVQESVPQRIQSCTKSLKQSRTQFFQTYQKQQKTFESAYHRLEEILNLMNQGGVSLEESLELYLEADNLMRNCSEKLTDAEQKIEQLIKNRNGKIHEKNSEAQTTTFEDASTL